MGCGKHCMQQTGRLEIVLSHPFARTKAKGWGTGLLLVVSHPKGGMRSMLALVPKCERPGAPI